MGGAKDMMQNIPGMGQIGGFPVPGHIQAGLSPFTQMAAGKNPMDLQAPLGTLQETSPLAGTFGGK